MTTKDEALRVAREALTKARSCVDATVSKEHAAWAHELDAALRTIALAVEAPILTATERSELTVAALVLEAPDMGAAGNRCAAVLRNLIARAASLRIAGADGDKEVPRG